MSISESPLRILVKNYANGLLEREQYLEIRHQLLQKLSHQGEITQQDLQRLLKQMQQNDEPGGWLSNNYSASDWIIIILGALAAAMLGYILFT